MPLCRSFLALLVLSTSYLSADEVLGLSGKNVSGTIASISATEIQVATPAGPVTVPLSHVLAVNIRDVKGTGAGTRVALIDDTVLYCSKIDFKGKEVDLTLPSGAVLKVPFTYLVSFCRDAQNQALTRKFEDFAGKRIRKDRVVILRDGKLNDLEGTVLDVTDKAISFKADLTGMTVELAYDRLHGLIMYRGEVPAENPICRLYDVEGNCVTALKLEHDGTKVVLTTTVGTKLTFPQEAVAKLDFNLGKLTYLSDMVPVKVVEKSGSGLVQPYRRNSNLDGEPIKLDKIYDKGLSMHAYTELEFNLNRKYKEFKGILGVDVRTGEESQPKVTIYCDGEVVFTGTVTAQKIQPVGVSVKNVAILRIVVDRGQARNILDLHDHVTLAEARVSQ